jgi:cell division transport system permease protein
MITKEQALNDLTKDLGEDPRVLLDYNPVRASIEVYLRSNYANKDSIAAIEKQLKNSESNINSIMYREDMIEAMNDNVRHLSLALTALAIILLVISVALINNTIQLSIYSKRFLIRTMKLVGATGSFIRKPFIRDNIFSGIIAAVLAIVALSALIYYLSSNLKDFMGVINVQSILLISVVVLVSGILITGISSYFAVNRFLNMDVDKLYN